MNFLHTYNPEPIALSVGSLDIQWYGVIIVSALVLGFLIIKRLIKGSEIKTPHIIDLAIIFFFCGLIGGRIGHVIGELDYYANNLGDLIKIWNGGLAIQGVMAGCFIALYLYCRRKKINIWKVLDYFVIILPLMQAIGRWGNYFNQELFGRPTDLPWGIPIDISKRPLEYVNERYFHPVFLYESALMLLLFFIMLWLFKTKKTTTGMLTVVYFMSFGVIRFSLDFIKIDLLQIGPLLLSQWISIAIILIAVFGFYKLIKKNKTAT